MGDAILVQQVVQGGGPSSIQFCGGTASSSSTVTFSTGTDYDLVFGTFGEFTALNGNIMAFVNERDVPGIFGITVIVLEVNGYMLDHRTAERSTNPSSTYRNRLLTMHGTKNWSKVLVYGMML